MVAAHLGGVVSVVVHDGHARRLADELEAAAGAPEIARLPSAYVRSGTPT